MKNATRAAIWSRYSSALIISSAISLANGHVAPAAVLAIGAISGLFLALMEA